MNISVKAKKLTLQLKANEDKYVSGQLDLLETLQETETLYDHLLGSSDKLSTANTVIYDSDLMQEQSRIAKQRSKYYKPDSIVFNPVEFSSKLALYYGQTLSSKKSSNSSKVDDSLLWLKMGDFAKKMINRAPTFNYIHGTFDADPVEIVKKKRRMREKDKVGKETQPQSMSLSQTSENHDPMIDEAQRILSVLWRLCKKSEDNLVCYFEFVIDPTSFTRTVENSFLVSLLVKEGCVRLLRDGNGLPCLTIVEESERKSRDPAAVNQDIISMSMDEWQELIEAFKFKKPLIPPRKPIKQDE